MANPMFHHTKELVATDADVTSSGREVQLGPSLYKALLAACLCTWQSPAQTFEGRLAFAEWLRNKLGMSEVVHGRCLTDALDMNSNIAALLTMHLDSIQDPQHARNSMTPDDFPDINAYDAYTKRESEHLHAMLEIHGALPSFNALLDITIVRAAHLKRPKNAKILGQGKKDKAAPQQTASTKWDMTIDAYVNVKVDNKSGIRELYGEAHQLANKLGSQEQRTKTIKDTNKPAWNQMMKPVVIMHPGARMRLEVLDRNTVLGNVAQIATMGQGKTSKMDVFLGQACVPLYRYESMIHNPRNEWELPLLNVREHQKVDSMVKKGGVMDARIVPPTVLTRTLLMNIAKAIKAAEEKEAAAQAAVEGGAGASAEARELIPQDRPSGSDSETGDDSRRRRSAGNADADKDDTDTEPVATSAGPTPSQTSRTSLASRKASIASSHWSTVREQVYKVRHRSQNGTLRLKMSYYIENRHKDANTVLTLSKRLSARQTDLKTTAKYLSEAARSSQRMRVAKMREEDASDGVCGCCFAPMPETSATTLEGSAAPIVTGKSRMWKGRLAGRRKLRKQLEALSFAARQQRDEEEQMEEQYLRKQSTVEGLGVGVASMYAHFQQLTAVLTDVWARSMVEPVLTDSVLNKKSSLIHKVTASFLDPKTSILAKTGTIATSQAHSTGPVPNNRRLIIEHLPPLVPYHYVMSTGKKMKYQPARQDARQHLQAIMPAAGRAMYDLDLDELIAVQPRAILDQIERFIPSFPYLQALSCYARMYRVSPLTQHLQLASRLVERWPQANPVGFMVAIRTLWSPAAAAHTKGLLGKAERQLHEHLAEFVHAKTSSLLQTYQAVYRPREIRSGLRTCCQLVVLAHELSLTPGPASVDAVRRSLGAAVRSDMQMVLRMVEAVSIDPSLRKDIDPKSPEMRNLVSAADTAAKTVIACVEPDRVFAPDKSDAAALEDERKYGPVFPKEVCMPLYTIGIRYGLLATTLCRELSGTDMGYSFDATQQLEGMLFELNTMLVKAGMADKKLLRRHPAGKNDPIFNKAQDKILLLDVGNLMAGTYRGYVSVLKGRIESLVHRIFNEEARVGWKPVDPATNRFYSCSVQELFNALGFACKTIFEDGTNHPNMMTSTLTSNLQDMLSSFVRRYVGELQHSLYAQHLAPFAARLTDASGQITKMLQEYKQFMPLVAPKALITPELCTKLENMRMIRKNMTALGKVYDHIHGMVDRFMDDETHQQVLLDVGILQKEIFTLKERKQKKRTTHKVKDPGVKDRNKVHKYVHKGAVGAARGAVTVAKGGGKLVKGTAVGIKDVGMKVLQLQDSQDELEDSDSDDEFEDEDGDGYVDMSDDEDLYASTDDGEDEADVAAGAIENTKAALKIMITVKFVRRTREAVMTSLAEIFVATLMQRIIGCVSGQSAQESYNKMRKNRAWQDKMAVYNVEAMLDASGTEASVDFKQLMDLMSNMEKQLKILKENMHKGEFRRLLMFIYKVQHDMFVTIILNESSAFKPLDNLQVRGMEHVYMILRDFFNMKGKGLPLRLMDNASQKLQHLFALFHADTKVVALQLNRKQLEVLDNLERQREAQSSSIGASVVRPKSKSTRHQMRHLDLMNILKQRRDADAKRAIQRAMDLCATDDHILQIVFGMDNEELVRIPELDFPGFTTCKLAECQSKVGRLYLTTYHLAFTSMGGEKGFFSTNAFQDQVAMKFPLEQILRIDHAFYGPEDAICITDNDKQMWTFYGFESPSSVSREIFDSSVRLRLAGTCCDLENVLAGTVKVAGATVLRLPLGEYIQFTRPCAWSTIWGNTFGTLYISVTRAIFYAYQHRVDIELGAIRELTTKPETIEELKETPVSYLYITSAPPTEPRSLCLMAHGTDIIEMLKHLQLVILEGSGMVASTNLPPKSKPGSRHHSRHGSASNSEKGGSKTPRERRKSHGGK